MEIADLLSADSVRILSSVSSKKRLFQELGEMAAESSGLTANDTARALQDRESLGPTGVGHGVALPHTRLSSISQIKGFFLRLDKPVDFESIDKKPVDLIFALFAPEGAGVDHLKALALVSRTMRDAATCTKLRANTDPATLYAILTHARSTQAA